MIVAADELRLLVERIERLTEEIKATVKDREEVYAEAKSRGFDPSAIRKLVAIRAKDKEKLQEEEAILETYRAALGV